MLSALHLLSYLAGAAGFLFVLLSLASGLLYVAEVIEEHSGLAKTVGQRTIYVIMALHVVFYFTDGLPWHIVALGIFCHFVYLQNFSKAWPSISLISPAFLLSCVLVVVSHFLSFSYFSERSRDPRHSYGSYGSKRYGGSSWGGNNNSNRWSSGGNHEDTFLDVATYFGVCVWLVPFYIFLSLSANDNVLPTGTATPTPSAIAHGAVPHSPTHARKQSSIFKTALSSGLSVFLRKSRGSSQREGLIASPSRSRPSSPLFPPTPFSPSANGVTSPNLYATNSAWGGGGSGPNSPNLGSYSPNMASGGLFAGPAEGMARMNSSGLAPRLSMPPRRATDSGLGHSTNSANPNYTTSPRITPPPPPRRPSMLAMNEQYDQQEATNRKLASSPPLTGEFAGSTTTNQAPGLTKRKVG